MVAGGDGEAVGIADGGADDESNGEVEVGDHAAKDDGLLGVLLAEEGEVGLDDVEEFGDDGADRFEVSGAKRAAKGVGEGGGANGEEFGAGVHFGGGGAKEEVGAELAAEVLIGLTGARVIGEIFGGGELGGVHEDGDDGVVAGVAAGADECGVSLVERAHGGDVSDAEILAAGAAEVIAGLGDGFGFGHVDESHRG